MPKGFLICIKVLVAGLVAFCPALLAQAYPVPDAGKAAATAWLQGRGISMDHLSSASIEDTAKRLTQAVYGFCQNGEAPADLNELFSKCHAACGGYSYVLRGLLEALGAETRYANLYNIPNQGNHTAVEVKLGDRWGFFDPTFGAFFTEDGSAGGRTLPLAQIARGYPLGGLESLVQQSRKAEEDFMTAPLEGLFSETFEHVYMKLTNYQVAEQFSTEDEGFLLSLDIPLDLTSAGKTKLGSMSMGDGLPQLQRAWLRDTNAASIDADPLNDVSFNASMLYNNAMHRKTTVSLYGLRAGVAYGIRLHFVRPGASPARVQIAGFGKGIRYPSIASLTVPVGSSIYEATFTALRNMAQIELRNVERSGIVHLLGIEVAAR